MRLRKKLNKIERRIKELELRVEQIQIIAWKKLR